MEGRKEGVSWYATDEQDLFERIVTKVYGEEADLVDIYMIICPDSALYL